MTSVHRRSVIAASGMGLALGFSFGNIGPIAELVSEEYGVALATVGVMTTAVALTHALAQVPSGRIVDRFGAKRIALTALALVVAANAVALIDPSLELAIPLRALMGLGTGAGFIAGTQYVREAGAVAQGVFGGAALGGAGLAVAVMPTIAERLGWQAPWISAVVVVCAACSILALAPRGPRPARAGRAPRVAPATRRLALFRDPSLYRLATMHMAGMGLAIVLANWIVTLLTRAGELDEQIAGILGSLILLVGIATRPLGGWIFRRYPRSVRRWLVASIAGCAVGALMLAAARPTALVVVGAVLIGFWSGIPFAAAFQGAVHRWPDAPGAAVGMVNMLGNVVIVVGTPLLGLAFSLPFDGQLGFVIVAGIWFFALLAIPSNDEMGIEPAGRRSARPQPGAA